MAAHDQLGSDHWLVSLSQLLDGAVIVGGLAASASLYRATWDFRYGVVALLAATLFLLFAEFGRLYRPWGGETLRRQFFQIVFLWAGTFFALLLLAYAFKVSGYFSRVTIGIWLVTTPLLLTLWRMSALRLFRRFIRRGRFKRKAVIWGYGEISDQVAHTIEQSPWLGLRLIEYVRDEETASLGANHPQPPESEESDTIRDLEQRAKRGDFDILYIALPTTARARIVELIDGLADTTVSVYMVPDYFTTALSQGTWSNLGGIPLISVYDMPFWGADGWLKRVEDIVFSGLFLLVGAVPMLLIALVVKLTSPGPALFKQRRYGMDGKEISVRKFRSMSVCEDGATVPQATQCDPRVTPVGALLRRTSLDELPQFVNVLLGDMSIVGPRPHAVAHNELYRKRIKGYMLRHKVRPGITGWAQINGWRGETDTLDKMEMRVEYDLWYIRNWSLLLDMKIISLTVVRGFGGRYAY